MNKYCLRRILAVPFMRNYFNDIMGGIVFGVVVRAAGRFWFKKEIRSSLYMLLILTAGIYWEYAAPLYVPGAVSDVGDIAAYLSGGICLLLLLKTIRREQ